jgi:hypothetical protein
MSFYFQGFNFYLLKPISYLLSYMKHVYEWLVREEAGPLASEGGSKVWMYHSHSDEVGDTNSGTCW